MSMCTVTGEAGTSAVLAAESGPATPGTTEQMQGLEAVETKAVPALSSKDSFPGFDVLQ